LKKEANNELLLSGSGMAGLIAAALEKGKHFKFMVTGFSMSPFIKNGDVAVISPFKHRHMGVGDVVACLDKNSQKLMVHRVIGKKNTMVYLKGDNTLTEDLPVHKDQVLGYVSKLERNGKNITFSLGPGKRMIALLSRMGLLKWTIDRIRASADWKMG